MTGLNIPDMSKIVYECGLIPVPVDIDFGTTSPVIEFFKKLINPKVKALMLTYIYGIVYPIDEIASICKEHGIEIVEDAAESFLGLKYTGSPRTAITMMSFGLIKRCSSFSGCLAFVRDPVLFNQMNKLNEAYPIQTDKAFLKKAMKTLIPFMLLNNFSLNFMAVALARMLKTDIKELAISQLRGFKNEKDYLQKFCYKPCSANLYFLNYRFATFSDVDYKQNITKLQYAVDVLASHHIYCPGYKNKDRGFWLFPVYASDANLLSTILNKRGVAAYLGATQLKPVHPPEAVSYTHLTLPTKRIV